MNRKQFLQSAFYGAGALLFGRKINKNSSIYLPVVQNRSRLIHNSQSFADALADPTIQPGDALVMEDGIYQGDFSTSTLVGTQADPIIIMPRHPGKVTIDGSLDFLTNRPAWVHIYDLELMDSRTDRTHITKGINASIIGLGLYGCSIHDLHFTAVTWMNSGAGDINECVFYNNGYLESNGAEHGYAIYTHNDKGGSRNIARNIFHNNIGRYTIHIYSVGENYLRDYTCEENIIAGDAVHTGGGFGLVDFVYQRNIQYGYHCQHGRYTVNENLGYHNIRGLIRDNEFIDLNGYSVNRDNLLPWEALTESGNIFYQPAYPPVFMPVDPSGYSLISQPSVKVWLTAFHKSARWLGSLAIFNRDSADTVNVDFSSLLGAGKYSLRNSQNMAETWSFVFTGSPVAVPLKIWTAAPRIGGITPANGLPVFAAFVIEPEQVF